MIIETTLFEYAIAAQLHAVAQAAYVLEAERIGCVEFPPLRESLDDLRRSSDRFLVCQQSGNILGALSFDHATVPVVITRLFVSPAHLRQGIATALLAELERQLAPIVHFAVSTAQANAPAVALYRRLGYVIASLPTSTEGIPLIHLIKFNGQVNHDLPIRP